VSFYPPKINDRFRHPRHAGTITTSNAEGTSASFLCGSFAAMSLQIDDDTGVIGGARFTTNGCGFMVSAADVLTAWLSDKRVIDLHGLNDSELRQVVSDELDTFPDDRAHCAEIVFEALRAAMAAYRQHRIEEFQGEKALICTCFGVSEETIVNAIAAHGLTEIDDVTAICRAGSGCGSCRMLIVDLIESADPVT
jgi:NifU-like protein